jgi:NAD(P)-dependent dehydrogenase (short-subunit alcohol dehydrogenase family)
MNLQNKTAIITGAAAGIGAASAAVFAREGAKVVAVNIDRELLDQISAQIGRAGGECLAVVADVSQRDQVDNVLRSTMQKSGALTFCLTMRVLFQPANLRRLAKSSGTARWRST